MLIKTEGLGTATNGERTWSEPYEIWVNPAFVTSVLPELKSIKLLGEKEYTKLTDDGFDGFIEMYERSGVRGAF